MGNCFTNAQPGVHQMFFPMYVVKVSDFLRMEGALLSHAELVKQNLLQKWEQGMYTVFISHQWLGRQHPDPSGAQTSVLRKLIARLEQEDLMIEGDTVSASYGQRLTLSEDTRKNILEGYLFLDWFAIPQVTARLHGVNEATTKSDAALAVKSIPAYVECADIFIALVPYVLNEEKKWCNHSTWIARGWCRAELWFHMLAGKTDTSAIIIFSEKEAKFMLALEWLKNSVVSGDFTVEADRFVVAKLAERALKRKISKLKTSGPVNKYRFYVAHQSKMLGQHHHDYRLQAFLNDFRFSSLEEASRDESGMNGVLCAMFCGDRTMLRLLATSKANMNLSVRGLAELGYFDGQTLLLMAAKSNQPAPILATLIELGADVKAISNVGAIVANFVRSAEQLKVIVEAQADLHSSYEPYGLTPLTVAASSAGSDTATVAALLKARCDPNPPRHGLGQTPLMMSILHSRGEKSPVDTVRLILESKADVNLGAAPTGMFDSLCGAAIAEVEQVGRKHSFQSKRGFSILRGLTPLCHAAWIGDPEMTQLLLDFRADPSLPCNIGLFPEDLAEENGHYHLLPMLLVSM
ncbi:unnamed protein product [Cladocopium goreaui]|uniref:Ankyrin-2 n=1 Tax=Cladocopium goreaui TaxID=2562237 RepID=A0A9P1BHK7_9DINO|nr:unnamed protein product [Cladocopium goreaui]